jgi:hypothetical protein
MASATRLTEARLARRPKGEEELRDTAAPGLVVRGGPRGWAFSVRAGPRGLQKRVTLGMWSPIPGLGLTLKEARVKAAQLAGRIDTPSTSSAGRQFLTQAIRIIARAFVVRASGRTCGPT